MTLPTFTPAPVPVVDEGKFGTHVDYKNPPACNACRGPGPLDAETLCCRECFRFERLFLRLLIHMESRGAPVASLDVARERREVPRLTDTSGPTGVALEVALVPQPKPGAPRKRP